MVFTLCRSELVVFNERYEAVDKLIRREDVMLVESGKKGSGKDSDSQLEVAPLGIS